jgi:hypothetical protein
MKALANKDQYVVDEIHGTEIVKTNLEKSELVTLSV